MRHICGTICGMAVELAELLLTDSDDWRSWLDDQHASSPGVWLVLHKKGGTITDLTYEDALQVALCYGWIDGQVARRDEQSYRQRFTPRRRGSAWSRSNVERVDALEAAGRMMPAGLAEVAAAKADGRWGKAYAGMSAAELPADLAAAIAAEPAAQAMLDKLDSANRYALIYRVNDAKRADTRERRIRQFVGMLARGETLHPLRQKRG